MKTPERWRALKCRALFISILAQKPLTTHYIFWFHPSEKSISRNFSYFGYVCQKRQRDVGNEPICWHEFFLECSYEFLSSDKFLSSDRQMDRKRCIWAHCAICTGGLKNWNSESANRFLQTGTQTGPILYPRPLMQKGLKPFIRFIKFSHCLFRQLALYSTNDEPSY